MAFRAQLLWEAHGASDPNDVAVSQQCLHNKNLDCEMKVTNDSIISSTNLNNNNKSQHNNNTLPDNRHVLISFATFSTVSN